MSEPFRSSTGLAGRVALVTGGARGQGRAHAVTLAERGADVVVLDIAAPVTSTTYEMPTPDDLETTRELVEKTGRRCLAVQADVRSTAEVEDAVARTLAELGRLDVVVANAGICSFGAFAELTDDVWDEMLGINLTGVFKTLRATVPHLVAQGWGRCIATASMSGRGGAAHLAHYSAAKAGVVNLVKSLALELGGSGVTANVVCPTTVDTPMVHNEPMYRLFAPDIADPTTEQVRPRYASLNPMGVSWLDPREVAEAAAFLASEEAAHVNGHVLEVSAGISARHL
ncbi:mycofactocin-coupled SDR family oxidoreductase [Blastococcus sp. SYSU D00820]